MMKSTITVAMLLLVIPAGAMAESGKLKICRTPRFTEMMDGKTVAIPAGTYTGACDKNGGNCRDIVIAAGAAKLGPSKSACVTINAELTQSDGKPIKAGEAIVPQWSITGFSPTIKAASTFRP